MRKCLVTGASGFVGLPLCQALKDKGLFVRALHRTTTPGPWDQECLLDFILLKHFQIQQNIFLDNGSQILEGIDTIFHLAGIAHSYGFSKECYWAVNVEATEQLLKAAVAKGVQRFIYFSSVKAAGNPEDDYGRSKQAAEDLVLDYGRKYPLEVSILRPALVYGRNIKGNLLSMIAAIDKGYFPPVPETGNVRSMIAAADVVSAAMKVASASNSYKDQIFTLTDGQAYSTRKIYDAIRSALSLKPISFEVPAPLLRWIISFVLRKPKVYERLLGSADYSAAAKESDQALGFQAKFSFYDVLPEIIQNYKRTKIEQNPI